MHERKPLAVLSPGRSRRTPLHQEYAVELVFAGLLLLAIVALVAISWPS